MDRYDGTTRMKLEIEPFLIFIILMIMIILLAQPTLPQCQEDVVIVGVGDFENGRWSDYECGPAVDDYNWSR